MTEATLIVAYVWGREKLKGRENRLSTSPGEDEGNEKEEGRTKKAENSASSLYNCLNAAGIAFIQLKHSLSLYIGGGDGGGDGGEEGSGRVAWAGGRSDGALPLPATYSDEGDSSPVAAESLASV